jgi:hypothetical protein
MCVVTCRGYTHPSLLENADHVCTDPKPCHSTSAVSRVHMLATSCSVEAKFDRFIQL